MANPTKCKEMISRNRGWSTGQCTRKAGHGPDEAYCRQHAKKYDGTAKRERLAKAIEKGKFSGSVVVLRNALFDASSMSGIPVPVEVNRKYKEYVDCMRDALAQIEKQALGDNDD